MRPIFGQMKNQENRPARAVGRAQEWLLPVLRDGSTALDATAGNGRDTLFLAGCVGAGGRVLALDIQPAAIAATCALLEKWRCASQCVLHLESHACLDEIFDRELIPSIDAAIFNLGYLPKGDPQITTDPASTIAACKSAAHRLRPGGRIAIVAYPGHPGGGHETEAVIQWAIELRKTGWNVQIDPAPPTLRPAPRCILVEKPESLEFSPGF